MICSCPTAKLSKGSRIYKHRMDTDYYDIDDILAEGEKVPCKFNLTVPGLGYLEGNPGKAIQKDSVVELPLWLASVLAICEILEESLQRFIDLLEPPFFNPKVLNALKTSAASVDLHSIVSNFYKMTEKWASMFDDEDLVEMIKQLFKDRAFEINNYANNTTRHINNDFMLSLDEYEKYLFKVSSDSHKKMKTWIQE